MQTHILIINRQLNFAVSIKQALERTGNFEVHPFTSLDPALDYLRGHMQDVALIDFTIPGVSGAEVVEKLREIQPKIALIATPRQPEELIAELGLQGTVNTPFTARELIPVVNKAIEGRRTGRLASDQARQQRPGELASRESPGQTRKGLLGIIDEQDAIRRVQTKPAESKPPDNLPEYTSIDNVLSTVAGTRALPPQPGEPSPPPDEPVPQPEVEVEEEYDDDFEVPAIDDLLEGIPAKPATTLDDAAFSAMLDELDANPDTPVATEFDELVNSMREPETQVPLPERHQQFVEFIVAGGGMDELLDEIERKKTDELPELDPSVFDKAAEVDVEEPPPPVKPEMPVVPVLPVIEEPQEEDEGTVGDIFSGVSDTSFRNVLSILRGEEPVEEDEGRVSQQDMREAFPQFFASSPTDIDEILNQIDQNAQREIIQTRDIGYDFDREPPDEINTARLILQTALDESTPIDSFSISDLIDNIEGQLPAHRPKVQPLPSWFRADKQRKEDDERYVREPDFLPATLPEFSADAPAAIDDELPELDFAEDWYDQTTRLSSAQQMEDAPEAMETEWLPADFGTEPGTEGTPEDDDFFKYAAYAPENAAPAQTGIDEFFGEHTGDTQPISLSEIEAAAAEAPAEDARQLEYDAYFDRMAAFRLEPEEAPLTAQHIDDPYIAQLALSLTEVSLELTAEATILTREGEIVAYAGRMAREELAEMREAIGSDWDANPDEARIRFINLEGSGKDYMLYARRTVEDLTLSLVFSGTTPLRDIRRQGKRLVEALQSVPETVEAPVLATMVPDPLPPEDTTPRTPYAYVWIIRDPRSQLNNTTAQAIVSGMNVQLRERLWQVQEIHAKNDYVYLLADVPGEVPPYDIVRELKRRSAHIAHAQNPALDPDGLWADGYLVVTPGRKLDDDEIQQFIEFERM